MGPIIGTISGLPQSVCSENLASTQALNRTTVFIIKFLIFLSFNVVFVTFFFAGQTHLLFHRMKSPTGCLWLHVCHKCLYFFNQMLLLLKEESWEGEETGWSSCNSIKKKKKEICWFLQLSSLGFTPICLYQECFLLASWKWHVVSKPCNCAEYWVMVKTGLSEGF